ncbi:hypothetical protein, partial [Pseudomonas fulva]|uniref:hypothetical protein n=1 Tax=Pseudomonas fulva TaxID=47880 RepID=UPI00244A11C4
QIKLVSCTGQPLKFVSVAVYQAGSATPKILTSDANGLLPMIRTESAEKAEIHFHWEGVAVPANAEDYEGSRNK